MKGDLIASVNRRCQRYIEKTLNKLAYIAIGGVLVVFGLMISPFNAQKDNFGKIECTKLVVVDGYGHAGITLSDSGMSLDCSGLSFLNSSTEGIAFIIPYAMVVSTQGTGTSFNNSPVVDNSNQPTRAGDWLHYPPA